MDSGLGYISLKIKQFPSGMDTDKKYYPKYALFMQITKNKRYIRFYKIF